ncbi:MAG: tandem-95 repeat protein, partial [Rhodopirellula sp.]|nr:tandem-95 repeat protein [Rhodopirellula sp.]
MFSVPFLSSRKTSISRRNRRSGRSRTAFEPRRMRVEPLEDRRLLSVVPDWVLGAGGPRTDTSAAVATDSIGNVYVTGKFEREADFDGDGIADAHSTDNPLDSSMYLAKYASSGAFEWVRVGNGLRKQWPSYVSGTGVAVDADDNVYVTGDFMEGLDLNGDMTSDLTSKLSSNFVVKYSSNGDYVWSTAAPVVNVLDQCSGIAIDDNDPDRANWAVYITGHSAADHPQTDNGAGYVAKLSAANGQMAWKRLWNPLTNSLHHGVDVDELGSVYVTGTFVDGFDVTNDGSVDVMAEGSHAFAIKYSSVGNVQWWTSLDVVSSGDNLDLFDGSVYIAGRYGVTKLDAVDGTTLWNQPIGAYNYSTDIAVATDGTAYLTGTFGGTPDLDGDGAPDLISAGGSDAFLATLDSQGHLLNAWGLGGVDYDRGYGVASDGAGNIYVTGCFTSTATFPTGDVLESCGGYDTFLLRLAAESDPPNTSPVAVDDLYAVNEDAILTSVPSVLANDSDADGDSLTAVLVALPAYGSLEFNADGSFTYTPAANFNGADSFSYAISDGNGGTDTATVSLTIAAVNDAPDAADDTASTVQNASVVIWPFANDSDIDGDGLTVSAVDSTSLEGGAITNNTDGTVTYTPPVDFMGTDSFRYTLSDGNGGEDTATVVVTVTRLNDAPVAADDAFSTEEDTLLVISVPGLLGNDTDADGDPLTAALVTEPANGTLTLNSDGSFSYDPVLHFHGTDSFTYQANDTLADSNVATVTITVSSVNDAPVASDDTATTDEGMAVTVEVLANDTDVDGDSLSVTTVTQPSHGAAA